MEWNLSLIFENDQEFETAFSDVQSRITKLLEYKEILSKDLTKLEEMYTYNESLEVDIYKVASYAMKKSDMDTTNSENKGMRLRAEKLMNDYSVALSWRDSFLIAKGERAIFAEVKKSTKLQEYSFSFKNLFRLQEKVMSESEESIISEKSLATSQGHAIYSSLATTDEIPVKVELTSGEVIEVSQLNYTKLLTELKKQDDRKRVFEAYFSKYENHKNTFASIYNYVLQGDAAMARIRNYSSWREAELNGENIPLAVYDGLVAAANRNSQAAKDYIELRRRIIGVETYKTYDRLVPLAKSDQKFDYASAKKLCLEAAYGVSREIGDLFKLVTEDGLVDVNPRKGKRSGAYSSSFTGGEILPFILLNHTETLSDTMTLMHEAGHSVHSVLASKCQPTATENYEIYVAEVGSIFAEFLLLDHLKKLDIDANSKVVMLEEVANKIMSTFFRQTLFAEYELEAHKLAESGQPVTAKSLSEIMNRLYANYYGLDLQKNEPLKSNVWAYIPHFYFAPYYVYKYATCFATSLELYKIYLDNPTEGIDKWIQLLKSGGKTYPNDIVKEIGIDLSKPETYDAVGEMLSTITSEIKEILKI